MRGTKVKAERAKSGDLHPGRKHGGGMTEPPSMSVAPAAPHKFPVHEKDEYTKERIDAAKRKRQERMVRNLRNARRAGI